MMTNIDLKKFLKEHFIYEVDMLYHSTVRLIDSQKNRHQVGINLSLETFLLHSRNIVEFLFFDKNDKYPDDARASDFISSQQHSNLKNNYSENLKKLYTRASKEVTHLTYSRIYDSNAVEKQWEWKNLLIELFAAVKIFLNQLPDEYKNDNEFLRLRGEIESTIKS